MLLTYDRPEMVNKVVFRRRPSTGTWEVCPPNDVSHSKSNAPFGEASTKTKQQSFQERCSSRKLLSQSFGDGSGQELKVHIALQQAAPGKSGGFEKSQKKGKSQKAGTSGRAATEAVDEDPDYKPGAKEKGTGRKLKPRGRVSDSRTTSHDNLYISQTSSKVGSPIGVLNCSQSSPQLVNHTDSNSISSRTRFRQTQSSPSVITNHGKLGSSPHRYLTRSRQ